MDLPHPLESSTLTLLSSPGNAVACLAMFASMEPVTSAWVGGHAVALARRVAALYPVMGDAGDGKTLLTCMCSSGDAVLLGEGIGALLDGLRADPRFFDGSEKRLQAQRAEALHRLLDASCHEAVLVAVVDEASRCFGEGGGGVGYFKRLSKVVVDASKVQPALEWLRKNRNRWPHNLRVVVACCHRVAAQKAQGCR